MIKLIFFLGGSFKILTFVVVVIFTTLRRNILNLSSPDLILDEVRNLTEESSEVIGNKAIELWQQYGSPLVFGDSRKEKVEVS